MEKDCCINTSIQRHNIQSFFWQIHFSWLSCAFKCAFDWLTLAICRCRKNKNEVFWNEICEGQASSDLKTIKHVPRPGLPSSPWLSCQVWLWKVCENGSFCQCEAGTFENIKQMKDADVTTRTRLSRYYNAFRPKFLWAKGHFPQNQILSVPKSHQFLSKWSIFKAIFCW